MRTTTVHTSVDAELLRWLLFSVTLALLPLAMRKMLPPLFGKSVTIVDLLKDGELLLIGVGLAGVGVSDILASHRTGLIAIASLFATVVCLSLASFGYGAVHAAVNLTSPPDVVRCSYIGFVACVIAGGAALLVKEWK